MYGASTDVDNMVDLHSIGHDEPGTSIDDQVNCKASDGLILPSAVNHGTDTKTQPKSNAVHSKIRNQTHYLIIYNIPEIIESAPAENRIHDAKAISEVFK